MKRSFFAPALALLAALALVACAEGPPPPTNVALTVTAAPDSNGGAPVKVKVYYLASTAAFDGADFFSVFDNAAGTLGADLVSVDEYLLAPGASVSASKSFQVPVSHVGVAAGFRDIDQPGWRATAPLAPNAANPVAVTLQGSTARVAARGVDSGG